MLRQFHHDLKVKRGWGTNNPDPPVAVTNGVLDRGVGATARELGRQLSCLIDKWVTGCDHFNVVRVTSVRTRVEPRHAPAPNNCDSVALHNGLRCVLYSVFRLWYTRSWVVKSTLS